MEVLVYTDRRRHGRPLFGQLGTTDISMSSCTRRQKRLMSLKVELATVEDGATTWQKLKSEITSYRQPVKASNRYHMRTMKDAIVKWLHM